MKHIANVLLGLWLILQGVKAVFGLHFHYDHLILGVLAMVAGVLVMVRN